MSSTKICIEKGAIVPKKPLVLSSQKWNCLLMTLNKNEDAHQQAEQERKYKEYLKEGSREMMKNWTTNVLEKARDCKPIDKKKLADEKWAQDEKIFKQMKENDIRERADRMVKVKEMVAKSSSGNIELESAAILSEVLRGREIQRNINTEFAKRAREEEIKENARAHMQLIPWIEEEQRRIIDKRKRNEEFKNDLIKCAKDNERRRAENSRRQTECEKRMREEADKELKAQIERERAILQRKKDAMRKNALEAMKMVEQRRMRDKVENDIDNKISSIISQGKQNIQDLRKEKERELMEDRTRLVALNAQVFVPKFDIEKLEDERLKKVVEERTTLHEQQEREKLQKEKMVKAARIKSYMDEVERQKQEKVTQMEQLKWSIANRMKNEEVNKDFTIRKNKEKMKKAQEIHAILREQVRQREENIRKEIEQDKKCANTAAAEADKFFFEYAERLLEEAKKKSRPVLPILKAVESYKKRNNLNVEPKEPKHLVSNIPIDKPCDCAKPIECPKQNECRPCAEESVQSVIKYDLDELKKLNPCPSPRASSWP